MATAHTITSSSVEETFRIGAALGRHAAGGAVLAMNGPLGAGKTHLAKGIATGIEVEDPRVVTSPTFVIINEYHGRLKIQHIDAYRLESGGELAALGFDELAAPDAVVLIEWAGRIETELPTDHLAVDITVTGETRRELTWHTTGPQAAAWLAATLEDLSAKP
jgi:tRNA threonylcarbamoyladenosine biosynthesis protein TsaE